MALREYQGGAKPTTVSGDFNAAATSFSVDDATGWPDGSVGPFTVVVNRTGATAEKMLATARTGTIPATITVPLPNRGYDDTAAAQHFTGETVEHVATAEDMRDANAHIFDTTRDNHTQYMRADGTRHDLTARHGAAVVDHGSIGGLADDDHPQYVLTSEHTKALHDALGIDHGSLTGLADDDHPQYVLHALADAKGDLLIATAADVFARFAVGADDTILMADTTAATGWKAASPATGGTITEVTLGASAAGTADSYARGDHTHRGIPETLAAAKGDLIVATSFDALTVLPVGADGRALTAAPAASTGLAYAGVAFGTLGYAQVVAPQSGITVLTDLTGLSVAVTVATGRRVKITGYGRVNQSVAPGAVEMFIYEGATELQRMTVSLNAGQFGMAIPTAVLTPSAGAHTYKLRLRPTAGSTELFADATEQAFILVEDTGPA